MLFRSSYIVNNINEIETLKIKFKIYAALLDKNALSVNDINFSNESVIIIGNEGKGISKELLEIANEKIFIPMSGNAQSLNASVAAGIIAWEMSKK